MVSCTGISQLFFSTIVLYEQNDNIHIFTLLHRLVGEAQKTEDAGKYLGETFGLVS